MPPKTPSTASLSAESAPDTVYGVTEARLAPQPLRPLTRDTTRGYDVIDFAEAIGHPLLPWQKWAVIHALEVLPDGTYRFRVVLILVARQNGKSHLMRVITLWRMLYDQDCRLVLGTAQDLSQASNQWNLTLALVQDVPALRRRLAYHRHVNGQNAFGFRNGAEYIVRSATPNAGRGFSVDGLIADEIRTHRDSQAWNALLYTTMARPNPLTVALSNAGDDNSVVLNLLREAALRGRDESVGLLEWSAPDGCELDDIEGWRQANPALGYTITIPAIESAKGASTPSGFRTECLCQRVDQLDGAVSLSAWDACADPSGSMEPHRKRIAACIDVSMDRAHITLALAARTDDGRARIEIAAAWDSTTDARAELPGILDRIKPVALAWYPSGPASALEPVIRQRPNVIDLTGGKVTAACQGLADLAEASGIVHSSDPLLNAQVKSAQKQDSGDGWRFARRGKDPSFPYVDAAYAAAGAVHAALTLAEPLRVRFRTLSA